MPNATLHIDQFTEKDKERFWKKVNKNGPEPDQSKAHYEGLGSCWVWTGLCDKDGYGRFGFSNIYRRTHRISYLIENGGGIDSDTLVMHKCDRPECVRPSHLQSGSTVDNVRDRVQKGNTAKGLNNGSYTMPHRRPSGDRHNSRTKPETIRRGELNGCSKMTDDGVRRVRILLSKGRTGTSIAKEFGVSVYAISLIKVGKSWKHVV